MEWNLSQTWNAALEQNKDRLPRARKNLWAGEIGGSYIDRYLKMTGVKPTNPPNARSLRKFEAGNMMEWLVRSVLTRVGILQASQEWLSYQYPKCLEVTGKLDFLAGGKPDWEKAEKEVKMLGLPEFFNRAALAIIDNFSNKFKNELDTIVLEVKSCSSFKYEQYEKVGADTRHKCQIFHYLKSKNIPYGHIVYISKDDLRLLEFRVDNGGEVEKIYKDDIEKMTYYINNNIVPPKEEPLIFDGEAGKFSINWRISYSNYLTMLYGFENQNAVETTFKKSVGQWNRVLGRCVEGKNMTAANLIIIEDIKKKFSNFDELVVIAKNKGVKEDG